MNHFSNNTNLDYVYYFVDEHDTEMKFFIEASIYEQQPDYASKESDWDYFGGVFIEDYDVYQFNSSFEGALNPQALTSEQINEIMGKRGITELETDILREYKQRKRFQDIEDSFFEADY